MNQPQLTEQQLANGCRKFLDVHPAVAARIEAINPELANILGVDLSELRRDETMKELQAAAAQSGIDSFEYLLEFAIESDYERERILDARNDAMKKALGL